MASSTGPTFLSGSFIKTRENIPANTAIYFVTATDTNGASRSYSIAGGVDASYFNINATTGEVSFKVSPDFEAPKDNSANNVYDIIVRALDGSSYTDLPVAISVINEGENLKEASLPFSQKNYGAGSSPNQVLVSDLNKDGRLDLIALDQNSPTVSVLMGNGDGTFQQRITSLTSASRATLLGASAGIASDFNFDGNPDLIITAYNTTVAAPTTLYLFLLGNGDGTFQLPKTLASSSSTNILSPNISAISVGDLNNDNKIDAISFSGGSYPGLSGSVDGGMMPFYVASDVPQPSYSQTSRVFADFNGDNISDYITVWSAPFITSVTAGGGFVIYPNNPAIDSLGRVGISLGLGDGTFGPMTVTSSYGGYPSLIYCSDLNNDGIQDIVLANSFSNNISVFIGNRDGSLQFENIYKTLSYPRSVAFGDVNGDKNVDILVANYGSDSVSILLGSGDGTFGAQTILPTGDAPLSSSSPKSVATGDFNNDGKLDFVVANFDSDNVSVFLSSSLIVKSSPSASAPENVSPLVTVYTASTSDPGVSNVSTYSISGGVDAALFKINASTGAVTFKASPNYEAPTDAGFNNVYDIVVQASDGSLTATKAVAITVTDVPESTTSSLHGMTYFWKPDATGKHALLSGVTVKASGGAGPSEGANAPIQVKNITWDGSGHVTADVFAHIIAGMDSFDLNLDFGTGANAAFTSAMDSSWTLLNNSSTSSLLISAYSMTATGSGDLKLGSLAFDVSSAAQAHIGVNGGSEISFNNVATKSTAFSYDLAYSTTGSDGTFSFSSVASGGYALAATRGIADIGNAITSADALSALKIAVSMNPNAVVNGQQLPVSPFQFMAADANGDGRVTSADALSILKMAVKLPSAITPEWMFVEDTRDFYDDANGVFTLNRSNASWDHNISTNVMGDTTQNLVGVLKGDVNGSWTPPTGSSYVETLQPNYFTTLANTIHAPISEFGVFG